MFVETYRQENAASMMAGGDAGPIPYPKISEEDWRVWSLFLPFRSMNLDRMAAQSMKEESLHFSYGIPYAVTSEIQKATPYFDQIEVWRKREVNKDPIAVGVLGGERYLIARWGMEKLIPFSTIKKAAPLVLAWKYATSPLGALVSLFGAGLVAWSFLV
ncbi:MAG TPA: hypothetical protein VNO43_00200 [Candidatus Eisenbacteria bacterium]|nr:hypothetical protein [Candidatus Eisenbacteria bacterium]